MYFASNLHLWILRTPCNSTSKMHIRPVLSTVSTAFFLQKTIYYHSKYSILKTLIAVLIGTIMYSWADFCKHPHKQNSDPAKWSVVNLGKYPPKRARFRWLYRQFCRINTVCSATRTVNTWSRKITL